LRVIAHAELGVRERLDELDGRVAEQQVRVRH